MWCTPSVVSVNRHQALKLLLAVDLTLVAAYLVTKHLMPVPSWTVRNWFDLDAEANIPTWFSSMQMFLISGFMVLRCMQLSDAEQRELRRFYILMACVFAFFSIDEVAMIHEGVNSISKKLAVQLPLLAGHGWTWIFVYSAVLLLPLVGLRKGLRTFIGERNGRPALLLGASLLVLGGVVIDSAAHYLEGAPWVLTLQVTLEEGLELIGQSLILYAVMSKLRPTEIP